MRYLLRWNGCNKRYFKKDILPRVKIGVPQYRHWFKKTCCSYKTRKNISFVPQNDLIFATKNRATLPLFRKLDQNL